tara:strand:+ start:136 stop:1251 length:1116 start_codon:yes stop_codon:yes gene_type:complete
MIDKGLYKKGRVGLKGGADASQFGRPSSQQQTVNVGAGGATLGNTPLTTYNPPSGGDSDNDGSPFRKTPPKKKKPVQTFLKQGVDYARKNPLQVLLGFLNPAFGAAMLGANFLNDPERRKRLTGYETQEEYDQARQDRINLNRIKTLENTIQKKYLDKNRSLDETNLDERLAALKSQMGITPNTAADLRPDLDFSNQSELAFEGIGSLDTNKNIIDNMISNIDKLSKQPNLQELYDRDRILSGMDNFVAPPGESGGIPTITFNPNTFDDNSLRTQQFFKNYFNRPTNITPFGTVLEEEFPSTRQPSFIEVQDTPQSRDDFFLNAIADAETENEKLLKQLFNPDTGVDEFIDNKNKKEQREQELLEELKMLS